MNMDFLRAQMHCRLSSMVCTTLHSEVPARAVFLPRPAFCKTRTRTVCLINYRRCRRQAQPQLVSNTFLSWKRCYGETDGYCTDSGSDPDHLLDLTGKITREGKHPCAHGGFADVWKGIWRHDSGDYKVSHLRTQRYNHALT
jgi:hypothetical protein